MLTVNEYNEHMRRICDENGKNGCKECFLYNRSADLCFWDHLYVAFDILNKTEQWIEEHPIKTNHDKYEEVFGVKLNRTGASDIHCCYNYIDCINKGNSPCNYCDWWDKEYIEQKQE